MASSTAGRQNVWGQSEGGLVEPWRFPAVLPKVPLRMGKKLGVRYLPDSVAWDVKVDRSKDKVILDIAFDM